MAPSISEGETEFHASNHGKTCRTWYRVVGDLNSSRTPLVVLHGGPGACHDYLLPLAQLAHSHSIPIVFYDQIGNGRSTHFPDKLDAKDFWTEELFLEEFDNLLTYLGLSSRQIDLFGHSWGGMLAVKWAAKQPQNLRRLIIANSLASMDTWQDAVQSLVNELPVEIQEVLFRCEERQEYESEIYRAAIEIFYKRHLSLARPWPSREVLAAMHWFAKDPTTHDTMYGPSKLYNTGTLRNWTCIPILHKINVPTLLVNGALDISQDATMQPFFDHIPKVKWITLDNAAHFSHVDQRERQLMHMANFLKD